MKPSLSWLSPSGLSSTAIIAGLVVAVFIYWGWDTCVSVNEEAKDSSRTPGRAAVWSTVILLAIYLIATYGAVSLLGPQFVTDNADEAIYRLGQAALPDWMVKLLVISILTSAAASCQTTILPATRTMLSMGSHGAAPPKLAQIDRKRLTPDFSTWLFGIGSIVWYVLLVVISNNTETDAYSASIAAVGMAIAVYYGLSGISCIVYYRRFLMKSVKNFFLIGVLPGFGGVGAAVRLRQDGVGFAQRRLRLRHAVRRRDGARDRHAAAGRRRAADAVVLVQVSDVLHVSAHPADS